LCHGFDMGAENTAGAGPLICAQEIFRALAGRPIVSHCSVERDYIGGQG